MASQHLTAGNTRLPKRPGIRIPPPMAEDDPVIEILPESRFTVFRLKRRREEEPLDSLLVETDRLPKQQRTEPEQHEQAVVSEPAVRLFQRVETVDTSLSTTRMHAVELRRKISSLVRNHQTANVQPEELIEARKRWSAERQRLNAKDARYRLINVKRQLTNAPTMEHTANRKPATDDILEEYFRLYDVVKEDEAETMGENVETMTAVEANILLNYMPLVREYMKQPVDEYVYDMFYLAEKGAVRGDLGRAGAVSRFESFDDDLYFDEDDEEVFVVNEYDDDSDSNAEDNWRNDYPDEEDEDEEQLNEDDQDNIGDEDEPTLVFGPEAEAYFKGDHNAARRALRSQFVNADDDDEDEDEYKDSTPSNNAGVRFRIGKSEDLSSDDEMDLYNHVDTRNYPAYLSREVVDSDEDN